MPVPTATIDPNDNGTQAGLNPALMQRGDVALKQIVTAIKESPVWKQGKNAIVVVWDENDYSIAPNYESGPGDRGYELRDPRRAERRILQSLFVAEIDRRRVWGCRA